MRAKVQRPFPLVRRVFGYAKVRYRRSLENRGRLALLLDWATC